MTHNTEIQWTHVPGYRGETWNPWTGCTKVSPGCAHCYIEDTPPFRKEGKRFVNGKIPITVYPDRLHMPLRWKKPRAIFVNSMSDLFHEDVSIDDIAKVFAVAALAPRHIYMVLTKRPERMREVVGDACFRATVEARMWAMRERLPRQERSNMHRRMNFWTPLIFDHEWPLRSVWLGVTIENRHFVHRAKLLRQTPAAIRFISAEPLLGPLVRAKHCPHGSSDPRSGVCGTRGCPFHDPPRPSLNLTDIDWLIAGGESGSEHRRIDPQWGRDLRDACLATDGDLEASLAVRGLEIDGRQIGDGTGEAIIHHGTAFFFKQWGGRTPKAGGRELDGRTWDEFPKHTEPVAA